MAGGRSQRGANVLLARSAEDNSSGLYPEEIQNRADPGVRGLATSDVGSQANLQHILLTFFSAADRQRRTRQAPRGVRR